MTNSDHLTKRFHELAPQRIILALEREGFWRAKEILQSRISGGEYDFLIFECFGILLLLMRDDLEAGKYLFLSGQRESHYEAAISLYLQKHKRAHVHRLVSTFPACVRKQQFAKYPESVQNYLLNQGYKRILTENIESPVLEKSIDYLGCGIGCLIILFIVLCFAIGLGIILKFISESVLV